MHVGQLSQSAVPQKSIPRYTLTLFLTHNHYFDHLEKRLEKRLGPQNKNPKNALQRMAVIYLGRIHNVGGLRKNRKELGATSNFQRR